VGLDITGMVTKHKYATMKHFAMDLVHQALQQTLTLHLK
jgi:hypothetical protein